MIEIPAILRLSAGAAMHAANRQGVVASNVANADTPGYRARDLSPFRPDDGFELRRTHPSHLAGSQTRADIVERTDLAAGRNGNTVDLEDQILRGIEAARAHDRAVTVYRNNIDILRSALGRR